jgi:IS5 family transposase
LAQALDWTVFDAEFEPLYARMGRPGLSTRLLVGLHYLKHLYDISDESVVHEFVGNPYWQYF